MSQQSGDDNDEDEDIDASQLENFLDEPLREGQIYLPIRHGESLMENANPISAMKTRLEQSLRMYDNTENIIKQFIEMHNLFQRMIEMNNYSYKLELPKKEETFEMDEDEDLDDEEDEKKYIVAKIIEVTYKTINNCSYLLELIKFSKGFLKEIKDLPPDLKNMDSKEIEKKIGEIKSKIDNLQILKLKTLNESAACVIKEYYEKAAESDKVIMEGIIKELGVEKYFNK